MFKFSPSERFYGKEQLVNNEKVFYLSHRFVWFRLCEPDVIITEEITKHNCKCLSLEEKTVCDTKYLQLITAEKKDGSQEEYVFYESVMQAVYKASDYISLSTNVSLFGYKLARREGRLVDILSPKPRMNKTFTRVLPFPIMVNFLRNYDGPLTGRKVKGERSMIICRYPEWDLPEEEKRKIRDSVQADGRFAERAWKYFEDIIQDPVVNYFGFSKPQLMLPQMIDPVVEPEVVVETPEPVVEETSPMENLEAFIDQNMSREAKINEFQKALAIREEILPQIAEDIASLESQMKELSEKLAKRQEDQEKAQALVDKALTKIKLYLK